MPSLPRQSCSRGDGYAGVATLSSRRHRDGLKTDSTAPIDGVNGRCQWTVDRGRVATRCEPILTTLSAHEPLAGYLRFLQSTVLV